MYTGNVPFVNGVGPMAGNGHQPAQVPPGLLPNPASRPIGLIPRNLPLVVDARNYAWINDGAVNVPAWAAAATNPNVIVVIQSTQSLRNYLSVSYAPGVTNGVILIGFGKAPIPGRTLMRLLPGAIYVWDDVVPQNDIYACMETVADPVGVLTYQFSTFIPGEIRMGN